MFVPVAVLLGQSAVHLGLACLSVLIPLFGKQSLTEALDKGENEGITGSSSTRSGVMHQSVTFGFCKDRINSKILLTGKLHTKAKWSYLLYREGCIFDDTYDSLTRIA